MEQGTSEGTSEGVIELKTHFNGFMKIAVEAYPNEAVAMLYTNKPYGGKEEEWYLFPIVNTSEHPSDSWTTTSKEISRVRKEAHKLGLTKLGNIHTHPHWEGHDIEDEKLPSESDLAYAKKYNDIVGGIWVIGKGAFFQSYLHDIHGKEIQETIIEASV